MRFSITFTYNESELTPTQNDTILAYASNIVDNGYLSLKTAIIDDIAAVNAIEFLTIIQ